MYPHFTTWTRPLPRPEVHVQASPHPSPGPEPLSCFSRLQMSLEFYVKEPKQWGLGWFALAPTRRLGCETLRGGGGGLDIPGLGAVGTAGPAFVRARSPPSRFNVWERRFVVDACSMVRTGQCCPQWLCCVASTPAIL